MVKQITVRLWSFSLNTNKIMTFHCSFFLGGGIQHFPLFINYFYAKIVFLLSRMKFRFQFNTLDQYVPLRLEKDSDFSYEISEAKKFCVSKE